MKRYRVTRIQVHTPSHRIAYMKELNAKYRSEIMINLLNVIADYLNLAFPFDSASISATNSNTAVSFYINKKIDINALRSYVIKRTSIANLYIKEEY